MYLTLLATNLMSFLADNQIAILHEDWWHLFSKQLSLLQELDLSSNQLTKLPNNIGKRVCLVFLLYNVSSYIL